MIDSKVTGRAALDLSETTGVQLYAYTSPTDEGGPISIERAREVAAEDSSLIYVTVPAVAS